MALPILDGNQSATTLSSILTGGEHIPAHTVVSLGTQAITDIRGAVSGSVVSISNFPATQPVSIASVTVGNTVTIAGTVTANLDPNASVIASQVENGIAGYAADLANDPLPISGTVTVGNSVTIGSLPAISGTVTANAIGYNYQEATPTQIPIRFDGSDTNFVAIGPSIDPLPLPISGTVAVENSVTIGSLPAVSGTVTIGSALPAGTNRIGVVTIGAGTVTIGAGTAQIGSVTASISGTVPISISSVTVGNSVTIASLPAISGTVTVGNTVTARIEGYNGVVGYVPIGATEQGAIAVVFDASLPEGTAQIGSVTASISNSVTIASLPAISGTVTANTFALQGTAVTTSNFTSTTASTVLAGFNAGREVLTIFNEGAGNLHICAGATCTTIAYQVRLSAGDYYEVPLNQTSLTHSAVFATAGTARVTEIS